MKRFVTAGIVLAASLPLGLAPLRADSFREIGAVSPLRGVRSDASAPGHTPARSVSAQITRPHPAVVRLIVPERDATSYGSGALVDVNGRYGLVITNWHVVSDAAGPPTVLFADYFQSQAQIVKFDREWDLAALVIWRPQVEPLVLATTAPRPGDWLSIAGYGQGTYRQIRGRCTQYLAPKVGYPEEMVELAASARQGDSGGPIFNDRGELAGVLFGEGDGLTLGAYCGRVREFLASVVPEHRAPEGQMVTHL
ncbi:MAG TPA: serine protease, partial [Pirellulales bacterium]|nr:serine protease [Pirellulales bacterium]